MRNRVWVDDTDTGEVCPSCRYRIVAGRCCCVLPYGVSIPEVQVTVTAVGFIVLVASLWVHVSFTLFLAGAGLLFVTWPLGMVLDEVERRRRKTRALTAQRRAAS